MTRVLVTGGSGYIASHVIDQLLKRGHTVVTTVRSESKANMIREQFRKQAESGQLGFVYVSDFLKDGAFDEAVVSDPPFEAVIHTASPLPHKTPNPIKDIVEPAISGTTGILHSTKKFAPQVKSVIITSSFAAIFDFGKDLSHEYSENDWNPIDISEVGDNFERGYYVSKTMAEKSAWDFLEKEKPNFKISTIKPPLTLGPLIYPAPTLDDVNYSLIPIAQIVANKFPEPNSEAFLWTDVRDIALAHVLAMEKADEGAGNERFFVVAGTFLNKELIKIIAGEWPEFMKDKMPDMAKVDLRRGPYGYNNTKSKELLGLEYRSLKECVIDTVKTLPLPDLNKGATS